MLPASNAPAESGPLHVLSVHDLIHMEIEKEGDGERVVVRGYLRSGIDLSLYPTRDHALMWDSISAVNVYEGEEADRNILVRCSGSYVEVLAHIAYREDHVMLLIPSRVTTLKLKYASPPDTEVCWTAKPLPNE